MTTLYTVGHSTHPFEKLAELLDRHGIRTVVDVRSQPYSRYNPQYNKEPFERALKARGHDYLFLGRELGGKRTEPEFLDEQGNVSYPRVAASEGFQKGCRRLLERAAEEPTAILCAEEDPFGCHRHRLVTRQLAKKGIECLHIRGDGNLETEDELESRHPPEQYELFQ